MPECIIELPKFHKKQQSVWESPASEILFAGDTRAGKSYFVRRSYIIYCATIPGLLCDIFRVNFDDVIRNHMEGETSFPVLLTKWEKAGLCTVNQTEIVFWNESRISLEHCADDTVMQKHQGVARHVRTLEESAQILERRVRALSGWVTMSEAMKERVPEKWKGQFPKLFHITNTIGPSAPYYCRNFVDARPPYSIAKVGQFNRQYIPAFVEDNPSEDAEMTVARIKEAFPDEAIQAALLAKDRSGISNWKTRVGEFYPEWNEDRHVVSDFYPPPHWFRYRSFDWGTADPAAVYWIAVSDGEPFTDENGEKRWFPRGARVFYYEWYICEDGHANPESNHPSKGRRLRNEDMANGILERSEYNFRKVPTLTDSKPFQDMGGEGPDKVFERCGVPLSKADTSRVAGWSMLRSALIGIEVDTNVIDPVTEKPIRIPMVFFCDCCKYARDYIPSLSRHKNEGKVDDAVEHGEATHACDAIRYGMMTHAIIKDHVAPLESRINKEVNAKRPTIKTLTRGSGIRF